MSFPTYPPYSDVKFNEMLRALDAAANDCLGRPEVRAAFVRNCTVDNVATCFRYGALLEGFDLRVHMGEYDNAVQEVMDTAGALYAFVPDLVVLSLKLEGLAPTLTGGFLTLTADEVRAERERVAGLLEMLVDTVRRHSAASILVHTFETPCWPVLGALDSRLEEGLCTCVRGLNDDLRRMCAAREGVYLVDADLVQSRLGASAMIDARMWHMARAPYGQAGARALGGEYVKILRALKGRQRKCLVLDCDNTLWGGIVGEDGVEGISMGGGYPGSAFADFQRAALELYNRGVLLAICSKNNEADVQEVLDTHPEMILRDEHFVARRINWNDKAGNLRELASELNIGLDSLVFADDSSFELNLIRTMLPEVAVLDMSGPAETHADILRGCGFFDSLAFSDEDRRRSSMYRAETRRKAAATDFTSGNLEEYYGYLEMEVEVVPVDAFSLERVAQLTQRTNQFNLTTRRYSKADVEAFVRRGDCVVRALRLKDRFGDMGIVGAFILVAENGGGQARLDSFMLSCRVIGRGVEDVLLAQAIAAAADLGARHLVGEYLPTAKNSQVRDFYPDRGFVTVRADGEGAAYARPTDEPYPLKNYFKAIRTERS